MKFSINHGALSVSRLMSCTIALAAFVHPALAAGPETVLLWPDGAPGAKGDRAEDKPTLTIYLPEEEKAVGSAVVICPGGGYGGLAVDHEGHQIAKWFNSLGVAGFIVEYRHRGKGYGHPAPLQDAQRAIRTVRAGAAEWKIDPKKIGVMGFSAGGHLASTTGTHFDQGDPDAADAIQRASCRPDFIRSLSNEKQVTARTPPTFLFHTDEDKGVPSENSVFFYLALRRAGVPAEIHIYQKGPHGVGLCTGVGQYAKKIPGTDIWPKCCEAWLAGLGMLDK